MIGLLIGDVISGRLEPSVANSANAGVGRVIEIVKLEMRAGIEPKKPTSGDLILSEATQKA